MSSKAEIREKYRRLREEIKGHADYLYLLDIPEIKNAKVITSYYPMPGEPLEKLYNLSRQAASPWEKALTDLAIRSLRDGGVEAVRGLEAVLEGKALGILGPDKVREMIETKLSLREASDLLAVLESGEADRLDRSRELLRKVVAVAKAVVADPQMFRNGRPLDEVALAGTTVNGSKRWLNLGFARFQPAQHFGYRHLIDDDLPVT